MLEPLGRSLVRYHLHPEAKFWGGDYDQRGELTRRHVLAETVQPIGKETDNLEEREFVGSDDAAIEYNLSPEDRAKFILVIKRAKNTFGLRQLVTTAKVSHHSVNGIISGKTVSDSTLITLSNAAYTLEKDSEETKLSEVETLLHLRRRVSTEGRNAVARDLGIDPSNLDKLLSGDRKISKSLLQRLKKEGPTQVFRHQ